MQLNYHSLSSLGKVPQNNTGNKNLKEACTFLAYRCLKKTSIKKLQILFLLFKVLQKCVNVTFKKKSLK